MSYLRGDTYRWFDNQRPSGRVYGTPDGMTGYVSGATPHEEWIGVAVAIAGHCDIHDNMLRDFLAYEFGVNPDNVVHVEDPEEFELSGPYRLNTQFAEVTLRALEKVMDTEKEVVQNYLNDVADAFTDYIEHSRRENPFNNTSE